VKEERRETGEDCRGISEGGGNGREL